MCCGGSAKKAVRSSQLVSRQPREQQKVIVQRLRPAKSAEAAPIARQYIIPRQACPRCQNTTMVVHIAGRERQQCTNINCRFVLV